MSSSKTGRGERPVQIVSIQNLLGTLPVWMMVTAPDIDQPATEAKVAAKPAPAPAAQAALSKSFPYSESLKKMGRDISSIGSVTHKGEEQIKQVYVRSVKL